MTIRVKAKSPGYFGDRYLYTGDSFSIQTEDQFSSIWMERLEDLAESKPKRRRKPPAKAEVAEVVVPEVD